MKKPILNRREMLENVISKGLLVAAAPMAQTQLLAMWQQAEKQANKPTPAEVLGPFFKKGAPDTKVLRIAGEPGFPLRIAGKVVNTRGEVLEGALVDVWQTDHQGKYDLAGYRYRAKLSVDAKGVYAVETIMPGHYSDRPAQHVHYMITAPGHKTLVTQLYFATDPYFDGDPDKNFNKNGLVSNRDCVRPVSLFEEGTPRASVTFDICLEKA